ncbi:MAG: autotransporter outer membrane beta-barrel domain-containing protein [Sphingobium sp.]
MSRSAPSVHRLRLSLVLGTSALAWGLILPTDAQAKCAPDPTVAGSTTICTGADADGIQITTPGTTLTVESGASVTNITAPAIALDVPVGDYSYSSHVINILGSVSAAGQPTITVSSGTAGMNTYYSTEQVALTIGAGGSVTGTTALALLQSPGNTYGTVDATIDNAGTMTGTGGTALLGNVVYSASNPSPLTIFSTINNQASGQIIGGIAGAVSSLSNAGLIDGGATSAVDTSALASSPNVINAAGGTIRSASTGATILTGPSSYLSVTNSGQISNTGGGAALSGETLTVTNQAGGQIAGGVTAIQATSSLNLVNQGVVTGNVIAGPGYSTIDSTAGTINGSLTLGSEGDTLMARYVGTRTLATGFTGTIDAGGGTNIERVVFASDTSVTTPIDLNAGFQQLVLVANANVTATLETGFATATPLVLGGAGTVVNRATINLAGTVVSDLDYAFDSSASFRNEGSITATLPSSFNQAGLRLSSNSLTNTGQITVNNGIGVSMSYNPVVNTGTITASGTGVDIFDGVLTNSGSIVSTGGAGINLFGNVGYTAANSGTIFGATAGAITNIYLTNTGTISSPSVGVNVQPYGFLINAANGVVNGGTGGAVTVNSFNAGVANAGTINGDVVVNGFGGSNFSNSLVYIAQTGGTLNGNLTMTSGTLVTDLVNSGPGQFAGITGTVTADSNSALRYTVTANASAVLPGGNVRAFGSVGYQMSNGAALTLFAPASQVRTQEISLSGNGSVDLDANIAVSGSPAIRSTNSISYPGAPIVADGLSIVSRGILSTVAVQNNDSYYYLGAAISLSANDSFTNAGTISITDHIGYNTTGIYGGKTVTNSGQIMLDGGVGIGGLSYYGEPGIINNTGSITQVAGGTSALGVALSNGSLDNSGAISVGGTAVQVGGYYSSTPAMLTNSGTLASTAGIAVTNDGTGYGGLAINNLAGGTITGGSGTAVRLAGVTLSNAGMITGTVDLGYRTPNYTGDSTRSFASSIYVANGGTVSGDLLFGDGDDLLLQMSDALGISGNIDGGGGNDTYGISLASSGTVAIDAPGLLNFESALVQSVGAGTVVTATGTVSGNLYAIGTGSVVSRATITGQLTTSLPSSLANHPRSPFQNDQTLTALTNAGSVAGGVLADVSSFSNSGTITAPIDPYYGYYFHTVSLTADTAMMIDNSGQISGNGLRAVLSGTGPALSLGFVNSGSIASADFLPAVDLTIGYYGQGVGGVAQIDNSGTITAQANPARENFAAALQLNVRDATDPFSYTITNSGTISATASSSTEYYASQAIALDVFGAGLSGTISNTAAGTISANADHAYAVYTAGSALDLNNAGTISATGKGANYAVLTYGEFANRIVNTGTISGNIRLDAGADTIDNAGTINGIVTLREGDDIFLQRPGGTVTGLIDGGTGTNSYIVDATGRTATLAASQISNFQRITQTGTGIGTYSGSFATDTISLQGGTLSVATGQILATAGMTTITGGDAGVSVSNAGTIAAGIVLGSGIDTVINSGTIGGAVELGAGDDSFTERAGSVAASVDGGDGVDLYRVMLAGDRSGIGSRTNFEQLEMAGTGTLSLTLDQDFQSIALGGTNLTLATAGHTVGTVTGSDASETVTVDGDVARVLLAGGNDTLALGTTRATGMYDGGTGNNLLRFTAAAPVDLVGTATNFQTISVASNALTVSGTLGSANAPLSFDAGDQQITVANGGTLAGVIDLRGGNDSLRFAAGGSLDGTVDGGGGTDTAIIELAGNRTLPGGLTGFETLTVAGGGQLSIAGQSTLVTVATDSDLDIAPAGSLTATQVTFGLGDNRFAIAGRFAGSVDGGMGNDTITVSGGSEPNAVAFGNIANVETFGMTGGFARISGTAAFNAINLTDGRLVGQSGSIITAPLIRVGQGATFGSAGTVNGNITVAGTLSPGASPATMTVNGNVALASGSLSLFELTPTISDKLIVNGSVSIASGSTLQLLPVGTLRPGTSYDLIVASGGITGSYTTVLKPADVFGFVVQRADKIALIGQFIDPGNFGQQVSRSIAYVNTALATQSPTSILFDALPALLTDSNSPNPVAFAQLTPEPYASATQMGVDNALLLTDAVRGPSFAAAGTELHVYTVAATLGQWHRLGDDQRTGTSAARTQAYGFLGGVGFGNASWSVAAFGGYLDNRQNIDALDARTKAKGAVAGLQGRLRSPGGFALSAAIMYDGSHAATTRSLPVGSANGRYDLHGWVGDVTARYAIGLSGDWTVTPQVGITYVRTIRDGLIEAGGSPFALTVSRNRHVAGFGDGAVSFGRSDESPALFRPFVSFGARYQLQGMSTDALAGYAGGSANLSALGAQRARVVGTAAASISYRLPSGLDLFVTADSQAGRDDSRESVSVGARLRF